MEFSKAIKIIDYEIEGTTAEYYDVIKVFFNCFCVDLKNSNGEYKSLIEIFTEAQMNVN